MGLSYCTAFTLKGTRIDSGRGLGRFGIWTRERVQRAATGHSQGIERVVREWMMGEVGNWVREYVRESLVLSETKSSTRAIVLPYSLPSLFPSFLPFPITRLHFVKCVHYEIVIREMRAYRDCNPWNACITL
jgi:hypothetical protein